MLKILSLSMFSQFLSEMCLYDGKGFSPKFGTFLLKPRPSDPFLDTVATAKTLFIYDYRHLTNLV